MGLVPIHYPILSFFLGRKGPSGKKNPDNHNDDSPEKTDEGIKQAEEEQADHDEESVRLDAGEKITNSCRCETHENF